jgi:hypothetical protein
MERGTNLFTEKRPIGLKIVIVLSIINSVFAFVHFFLVSKGIISSKGLTDLLWIFGVSCTIFGALPVLFGSYGLYQRKMWGLAFFSLGSGTYLCFATIIIILSVVKGIFDIMFYAAIYLILFKLIANAYVWVFRHRFSDI